MKKGKIKSFLKTTSTNLTIAMVTGLTFTSIALASETQLKDYVEPKDPTVTAKDLSELEVDSNLLFDRNFHGYNTWFAKKDGIAISVSDKLDEKYHEATAQNVEYLNRAFELINDDYKFKIVQGEGDIRILPLEDEWISVNRENIDETARKIGVGAIIFNDLNNSRIKDEIFDWDMMLNFNGETGPYIQYMYVRTKSILDKAEYIPNIEDMNINKLLDKESINIIKDIYSFNDVVVEAANKNEPSIISRYVLDIAKNYSIFYNNNRILSDDEETTSARLYLTYMVNIVIKNATSLLGMEMPDKM